jgi:hypothetical protein
MIDHHPKKADMETVVTVVMFKGQQYSFTSQVTLENLDILKL